MGRRLERVWSAWGWNLTSRSTFFQVIAGRSHPADIPAVHRVAVMSSGIGISSVIAGGIHSMVLLEDGSVWATGGNMYGQLGDGTMVHRSRFVKVMPGNVVTIAAGVCHSMVLKQDGSVWAAGWNAYGQLGDGSKTDKHTFVRMRCYQCWGGLVSSGTKSIAAGTRHSILLKQDGSLWATGYNRYGQLGDFSTTDTESFMLVIPGDAVNIAAGGFHSMLIMRDGTAWATGANQYGQFGVGSSTFEHHFVKIFRQSGAVPNAFFLSGT